MDPSAIVVPPFIISNAENINEAHRLIDIIFADIYATINGANNAITSSSDIDNQAFAFMISGEG